MKNKKIQPVILCGGVGSRLWPLSRTSYPKQFLSLNQDSNNTFLQETYERLIGLRNLFDPIIICNEMHRFIVAEQLREKKINASSIFLEPFGKNTAPAVLIAAFKALENDNDANLLVLSADHFIKDKKKFKEVIEFGAEYSQKGNLVTFGVCPDSPETGYGYIKVNSVLDVNVLKGLKIESFVEKPDLQKAKEFLTSKKYLWNSGIFIFKASVIINEVKRLSPEIYSSCLKSFRNATSDLDFLRLNAEQFNNCPNISLDKAVMEKTNLGIVIPMNVGWSDVGNWKSLWSQSKKNSDRNILSGKVITDKVFDSYIMSNSRLVVGLGLENLIIIETNDAILIANKDKSQDIKKIVSILNKKNFEEGRIHKKVFRPWGSYMSIAEDAGWQVKRINVKPGASLSLQKHRFRTEHWIVVSGTAKVQIENNSSILKENESTYIPLGFKHRLSNPGDIPLILIEVQSGSYLGEDDIERFDDYYGRDISS